MRDPRRSEVLGSQNPAPGRATPQVMGRRALERPILLAPLLAALTLALMALAGCGGDSGAASSAGSDSAAPRTGPSIPGAPDGPAPSTKSSPSTSTSGSSSDAVATVAGVPLSKTLYEHWAAIERAHEATAATAGRSALGFLITYEWVLGEAAARHISVSEGELKKRLAQLDKQSFPKSGSLHRFMASTGETEADLEAILRVQLLKNQIAARVTAGDAGPKANATLAAFEKAFREHWRRYTTCETGYVMEDCSQSKK